MLTYCKPPSYIILYHDQSLTTEHSFFNTAKKFELPALVLYIEKNPERPSCNNYLDIVKRKKQKKNKKNIGLDFVVPLEPVSSSVDQYPQEALLIFVFTLTASSPHYTVVRKGHKHGATYDCIR